MSSWFTDLAGKAENILNKIDQNAASVLKNDSNDRDQLIEVKTGDDIVDGDIIRKNRITNGSPAIRSITSNALKLPKSPKKTLYTPVDRATQDNDESIKNGTKLNNIVNGDDGTKLNLPKSNASNSSRRSSCSSRTEGIQTVIEYPIAKHSADTSTTNVDIMHTSTSSSSMHGSIEEKNEMMASRIILAQLKAERDQMKSEIIELKNQLIIAQKEDLVSELTATCDQLSTDNESLQRKMDEFEEANNGYTKTISQLEVSVAKMHEATMEMNEKLAMAKTETEQAVFELQQYRSRAQHTLQMKDELIAELKSMHKKSDTNDDMDIDVQCKQIELTAMKQERDAFFEENNMLRNQLNANKQIISTLECKLQEIELRSSDSEKSLSNALKQEKLKYSQMEETMRTQAKELKVVRDELKRQQTLTSTKLHEKENELIGLRTKLSKQQNTSAMPTGLNSTDDRVYSLTQSLVQKQNSLEQVTAERNAIRIQLEKLESQHRETMTLLRHQRLPQIINVNDTDDAKSQVPNFMRENPFDTRVARRMKRAYSSLDAAGVRLGVFLRRYPLVRTMTIVYVAVLHLWVMFVLLSSTPSQTN
ncbi:golgin-84 [Contarinia nasturtii]|uniref:golgin-84 n=1 Tax=Contarinia nasturtii TaxID=265458 RepID=UPI0012D37A9E|nr:golgin-84 [Contarinia nasturtii]